MMLLSSPISERMFVPDEEYYTMWEKGGFDGDAVPFERFQAAFFMSV